MRKFLMSAVLLLCMTATFANTNDSAELFNCAQQAMGAGDAVEAAGGTAAQAYAAADFMYDCCMSGASICAIYMTQ